MLKKRFACLFVNYQLTAYQKAKHLHIFPFSASVVSIIDLIPSCSMFSLVFVHSREKYSGVTPPKLQLINRYEYLRIL